MKRFILTVLFTAFTPVLCLADWGPNGCEPVGPPRKAAPKMVEGVNGIYFGLQSDKLHKDGKPHYHLNGREVEKHHVISALTLSDDSAKPFVTFIGAGASEQRDVFLTTPEAAKCRVNAYPATDWHVTGGFVTSGAPTVYVQRPDGEVLFRGDNPPIEAVQAEARKAQPDYDPAKDPNGATDVYPGSKYVVPFVEWVKERGQVIVAIGLIAGIFMLAYKKG